jgi:hypothetical protein
LLWLFSKWDGSLLLSLTFPSSSSSGSSWTIWKPRPARASWSQSEYCAWRRGLRVGVGEGF